MKIFNLIYVEAVPYLRQRNPLEENRNLVSQQAYEDHERQFISEAIRFLDPIDKKRDYTGEEIEMFWRFSEDSGETWVEVSEPNFIDTHPDMYEQVFRLKKLKAEIVPYQERVDKWVCDTFSSDVARHVPERCFRFVEEAIELAQSLGMSREDIYRHVTRTYSRPVGDPFQEIGGVAVTLNALASSLDIGVVEAAEKELANNIKNAPAIREKWLSKITISPLI